MKYVRGTSNTPPSDIQGHIDPATSLLESYKEFLVPKDFPEAVPECSQVKDVEKLTPEEKSEVEGKGA